MRAAPTSTSMSNMNTFQSLDDVDLSGLLSFWAKHVNEHDPEVQELLLQEDALKEFLPPTPALRHSYITSSFVKHHDFDEDDEALEQEIDLLREECQSLVNAAHPMSQSASAAPGNQVGKSVKIPATPEKSAEVTDKDQYNARVQAWTARYNHKTNTITLVPLSKFLPQVRDGSTGSARHKATKSILTSIEESMADGTHFLCRSADFPRLDKVSAAFISDINMSVQAIQSLDMNSSDGFVLPMIMPDSASTAKTKSEKAGQTEAEDVIEEHESKCSKQSTTFTSITDLKSEKVLLSALANIIIMALLYANFDVEANDSQLPSIVYYAIQIALNMTTKRAQVWLKDNPDKRAEFLIWILNQVISISICFARASHDVVLTSCIVSGDSDSISTRQYKLAHTFPTCRAKSSRANRKMN